MASLFISHSSRDNEFAQTLRDRLTAEGYDSLFLDFDPERGIPVGRNWERELYAQMRTADAVVFLGSRGSLESKWCFAELALARSIGKPIFPLLTDGSERHPLLDDLQWLDVAGDVNGALIRLFSNLAREGLDPGASLSWDPTRPPYPGLASFEAEDAAVFFGREDETDDLLGRLHPTLERPTGRLIALIGPSGSGKSSLLRAGVLPRLLGLRSRWVVVPPFVPGENAIASLAYAVAETVRAQGRTSATQYLERQLRADRLALAVALTELRDEAVGHNGSVLLAVDQADELAAPRTSPEDRSAFVGLLAAALERVPRLWIIATSRPDLLATALQHPGDPDLALDVVSVKPLGRSTLPRVIEAPAARAGIDFEPGVVGRIAEDAAGGDALPLLAYTLRQLWERVGSAKRASAADYDAIGGVAGAVSRRADGLVSELAREGKEDRVVPTLLELTAVDAAGEPTRRRLPEADFDEQQSAVIEAFVRARLLRRDSVNDERTVEVTHEALLRAWPPLRTAIENAREQLRLRSELAPLAEEWARGGHRDSYLLRGERLDRVEELAGTEAGAVEPSELERAFVTASVRLATRERRLRRGMMAALAALAFASAVAGVAAIVFGINAGRDRDAARAGQLVAEARVQLGVDPQKSLALAVRAADYGWNADVEDALRDSLLAAHGRSVLSGHRGMVRNAVFSDDGRVVVTAGNDGTARIWESAKGRLLAAPRLGTERIVRAAFAAGDSRVIAVGDRGTIGVWRVPSGELLTVVNPRQTAVNDADLTRDGRLIATADAEGTAHIWTAKGERRCSLGSLGDPLTAVAFDAGGSRVATAGADGTARVWSVATCKSIASLVPDRGRDPLNTLALSPDGSRLVVGDASGRARVWLIGARRLESTLEDGPGTLVSARFSPDGQRVVTAGADGIGRIWEIGGVGTPTRLLGHVGALASATFSRDGRLVVTAGEDGTAHVLTSEGDEVAVFRGHTGRLWSAEFDRGGRRVVTASEDGTARVWEIPRRTLVLAAHSGAVSSVASNGDVVATGDEGGGVRLWDARTGDLVRSLGAESRPIARLAFSADGRRLLAVSTAAAVDLWDVSTGHPAADLRGPVDVLADAALSPAGTVVVTGGTEVARLWSLRGEGASAAPEKLSGHRGLVEGVAIQPRGGQLVATGDDAGVVRLWDPATLGARVLGDVGARIVRVAFTQDGSRLLAASVDGHVRAWNAATAEAVGAFDGLGDALTAVAFNPDGTIVLGASSGRPPVLRIVRLEGGELGRLVGHTGPILTAEFSPDGSRIVTAGEDGTARVWTVTPGEQRGFPLRGHRSALRSASFAADRDTVVTASEDGSARVFACEACGALEELLPLARSRLR